jgi:RimJ/RimL family protein N-acetyltransferase
VTSQGIINSMSNSLDLILRDLGERQTKKVSCMLLPLEDEDFTILLNGCSPAGWKLPDGSIESPEVLDMLRSLAQSIRQIFSPAAWLIVSVEEIVGMCSLVQPPSDGGIDIGYGIAEARWQRGFASDGIGALVKWAQNDVRINSVRAEPSAHNLPSQRVLERNTFARIGMRTDHEDGDLVLCAKDTCNLCPP